MAQHARVQEDLHTQRRQMDAARVGLIQRREMNQDHLRRERERLATRAWWQRPTAMATSSWVSSGGERAATTTPAPSATPSTTWPPLDHSVAANAGDLDSMEVDEEAEIRTVRMVDLDRNNAARDRNDRGRGRGGRGMARRGGKGGRYMDD